MASAFFLACVAAALLALAGCPTDVRPTDVVYGEWRSAGLDLDIDIDGDWEITDSSDTTRGERGRGVLLDEKKTATLKTTSGDMTAQLQPDGRLVLIGGRWAPSAVEFRRVLR